MKIPHLIGWSGGVLTCAFALLVLQVRDATDDSPTRARHARLMALSASIGAYSADVGHMPNSLSELIVSRELRWQGPYARSTTLIDPDGLDVQYTILDTKTCRYRLAVAEHISKSGKHMPEVMYDDVCDVNRASE